MSEIKNRIRSGIIAARKKQNKSAIEVLAFTLDRIEETERSMFIAARRPGSEYDPTFEEINTRRKALTAQEEAKVVMNTIRNYNEEIEALKKLQRLSMAKEKEHSVSLLQAYLSDFRKELDQLDDILLELCIKHDIVSIDEIPKAMKITQVELCFEDQAVIYNRLKALFK